MTKDEVLDEVRSAARVANVTPLRPAGAPLTTDEVLRLAREVGKEADPTPRIRSEVLPALARLDPLDAARIAADVADVLGVPKPALRQEVGAARKAPAADSLDEDPFAALFPPVEPWPEPVDLADVLDKAVAYLSRFAVLPRHAPVVLALWAAMTWAFDSFERLGLLLLTSPAPRSGKSTTLELLGRIACRPLSTVSLSAAALYRVVSGAHPTLLLDEADNLLAENQDLAGVVNAAHAKESARVVRVNPETMEVEVFECFAPLALAGNNPRMPPATRDRCIAVRMVRRGPGETCERARARPVAKAATPIRRMFARIARDLPDRIATIATPELPDCLHDRAADCWESLFVLAVLAGRDWPARVHAAAVAMSGAEEDTETLGVRLLADLRALFEREAADRLSTDTIIRYLTADPESPWADMHGERLTPRRLAGILKPFSVRSRDVRVPSGGCVKGYLAESFVEPFSRYLPAPSVSNATTRQASIDAENPASVSATVDGFVAHANIENPAPNKACRVVADRNPPGGLFESFPIGRSAI